MRKNLFGAIALLLLTLMFIGCSKKTSISKVDKLKDKSELTSESKDKLNIDLKENQSTDVKTITKNDIIIVDTDSTKTVIHKETKYEIVNDKDGNPVSLPVSDKTTEEHFTKSTKAVKDKTKSNIDSRTKSNVDIEINAIHKKKDQINNNINAVAKSDSTTRSPVIGVEAKSKILGYAVLVISVLVCLVFIYLFIKSKAK